MNQNISIVNSLLRIFQVFFLLCVPLVFLELFSIVDMNMSLFDKEISEFNDFPTSSKLIVGLLVSTMCIGLFFSLQEIVKVFKLFKKGKLFIPEIYKGLRYASFLFLGLALACYLVPFLLSVIEGFPNFQIILFGNPFLFFIVGLCFNIFSKVFEKAWKLQQENQLTI